jgi:hypothetical protein
MDGMMAGMKTQMVMMVPQMVIMGWINFFFQGFVLSQFASITVSKISLMKFTSQAAIPIDSRLQVDASTWYRDT